MVVGTGTTRVRARSHDEGTTFMGMPISEVGGVSAPVKGGGSTAPAQSPVQSPVQTPTQSPSVTIWPPAYGYRRSATEGNRSAHNGWQEQWLQVGPAITKGSIDTVAALKPIIEPLLKHGSRGRWA